VNRDGWTAFCLSGEKDCRSRLRLGNVVVEIVAGTVA
jgi:hypothetical protein